MRKETVTVKFTPEQITFLNALLETHIENYELIMKTNLSKEYSSRPRLRYAEWEERYRMAQRIRMVFSRFI